MAQVIREKNVVNDLFYPAYIKTSKSDKDFLWGVLYEWAQYPTNEATALMQDAEKEGYLEDKYLRSEGFYTEMNFGEITPPSITLIKFDEGKWVIPDMNFEELEEFAESIEGNLE